MNIYGSKLFFNNEFGLVNLCLLRLSGRLDLRPQRRVGGKKVKSQSIRAKHKNIDTRNRKIEMG